MSPHEPSGPVNRLLEERSGGDPKTVHRLRVLLRWLVVAAFAVGFFAAWHLASAETFEGHVIGVSDGDTITVLNSKHQQLRVRLAGIDAPERGPPFSARSHENLTKLVRRQVVVVQWHKKDRYGRLVGVVLVDGHDVNLEQVRAGLAWWYRQYAKEQTPEDREVYELAEKTAKERKLGLWIDPNPMPPREWRRSPERSPSQPHSNKPVALVTTQTVPLDNFFNSLKRPESPNNWLVAPADFVIKPDAVVPVFPVSVSVLRDTFKAVVLRSKGAEVAEESANAVHIIATTPLMRFKDDIWVLFIPVTQDRSTLALYSASRVGYWDLGTNRRRLEDWTERLQNALGNSKN